MKSLTLTFLLAILSVTLFSQTFQWAKQMGGTTNDECHSVAIDASGNVYTTGFFSGTVDFDPGVGTYNLTSAGLEDIFVSKLDANGNFVWAKKIGDISYDEGRAITTDLNGNIYITGYFGFTVDFNPGSATYNLTSAGNADIFVLKLNSNGTFLWARGMGGADYEESNAIAVDDAGNIYTTGNYTSSPADFDPGAGTCNLTTGYEEIFISKLDASGNFIWAKQLGGPGIDRCFSIALDNNGNVYTTGVFEGTADFDPGSGTYNLVTNGAQDIFISKLSTNGNLVWAKHMGGLSQDDGYSITVDANENVYTTGVFSGTADFDPDTGIYNLTYGNIFVSKLDINGNFVWARQMGGSNGGSGYSIALDSFGNIYSTGYFTSGGDFDPGQGVYNLIGMGGNDVYISKLDNNGNFMWAQKMGGTYYYDHGYSIITDSIGNIYIAGIFEDVADFNPPLSTYLTSNGGTDNFVVKYNNSGVGISGIDQTNSLFIYPNPTTCVLNIDIKQIPIGLYEITLTNSMGQAVIKNNLTISNDSLFAQIYLKDITEGLYFLTINSDNFRKTYRIQKN